MIGKERILRTSVAGLLLATCSVFSVIYMERIERWVLEWFMVLRPGSFICDLWQSPTIQIDVDLYIFNWTNAEDVTNTTIKPRFEELGPYRFTEKMQKLNVEWHDDNSTVSYMRKSRFDFVPEKSAGLPTDRVVAPNLIIVGLYQKMLRVNPFMRSLMIMALNVYGKETTMVKTASEWMFDGFETPLIKMGKVIPPGLVPEMDFDYEKVGYAYPVSDHIPL